MVYRPYNAVSKTVYTGNNVDILTVRAMELNVLDDPRWMTFAQAKELGAYVRKGEKSTRIAFFSERKDDDGKKHKTVKHFNVFHVSQIEGL